MQLGGLPKIGTTQENRMSENDFDFSALEKKVDAIKQMQIYTMVALVVIVVLTLSNKSNG
jgi:hypothetical protein